MRVAKVKYLHEFKDRHGKARLYVRFRGRRVPIKAEINSPEFWKQYATATEYLAESPRAIQRTGAMHVYVISSPDHLVKIGIATDLKSRLSGLQSGNGHKLSFYRSFCLTSQVRARALERHLHKRFAEIHVSGEWFSVSPRDVVAAIRKWVGEMDLEFDEILPAHLHRKQHKTRPSGKPSRTSAANLSGKTKENICLEI